MLVGDVVALALVVSIAVILLRAPPPMTMLRRAHIVMVEGTIAVGKSTFVQRIYEQYGLPIALERIGALFLASFYAKPREYGFALQMAQHAHRSAAVAATFTPTIFDRSVLGDYAFALWNYAIGNLTDEQWRLYQEAAGVVAALPPTGLVIFLSDSTDACVLRQQRRDTTPIDRSYMMGLEAAHLIVMARVPKTYPLIELHWDEYSGETWPATLFDMPARDMARRATLHARADAAIDLLVFNKKARDILRHFLHARS